MSRTIKHDRPGVAVLRLRLPFGSVRVAVAPGVESASVTLRPEVEGDAVALKCIEEAQIESEGPEFLVTVRQSGGGVVSGGGGRPTQIGVHVGNMVIGNHNVVAGHVSGSVIQVNDLGSNTASDVVIGGGVVADVTLPPASSVYLSTETAGVTVTGLVELADVITTTGDVEVERAARVEVRTQVGSVRVGRADEVWVRTTTGAVRLRQVSRPQVRTQTGDIEVEEVRTRGRFTSQTGDITLTVSTSDVEAVTTTGDIAIRELADARVRHGALKTTTGSIRQR